MIIFNTKNLKPYYMARLLKIISLIYFIFIIISELFFYNQFSKSLVSEETFVKVSAFTVGFTLLLLLSYKVNKRNFDSIIEKMDINEKIAIPPIMFAFLGGFSIALAVTFIAFLEALGILFIVKTTEYLVLNILALVSFFWLAFILFVGWDFMKIIGIASQYSMIKDIESGKKTNFLRRMKLFLRKLGFVKDTFLAFILIDRSCKSLPRLSRLYYKNLLYPVKIWTACLTLYENKNIADALKESFEYFRTKSFKIFYTSNLASLFLPLIIIPVGLSLSIILPNVSYFTNVQCFSSNCFFIIFFFLVFMSLGFFFSYSISMSLESAYYVKILSDIKEDRIINSFSQDRRIRYIEEECYKKISELKGSIWDVIRIHF
jgi:hypothetical protein